MEQMDANKNNSDKYIIKVVLRDPKDGSLLLCKLEGTLEISGMGAEKALQKKWQLSWMC